MATSVTATLPRDLRVIALIGTAHFTSHFFQLVLPPLFPLMKDDLGASYVGLGLLVSLFYAASGTGQLAAGFLVDRLGARPVLLAGTALLVLAVGAVGLAPWYVVLLPLAVLAGLGNGVFHPADYALINASVHATRVARAYSVHQLTGTLGYAAGPAIIVVLAAAAGWRAALVASGALGLGVLVLLAGQRAALSAYGPTSRVSGEEAPGLAADVRLLLTAPIVSAFAYFALHATAQIGFQTFAVTALARVYDVSLPVIAGALTAFLLGSAGGVLAGGVLADRLGRPERLAAAGLFLGAGAMALLAAATLPPAGVVLVATLAGACLGLTAPARDLLVRAAAPPGAMGKVFGFAYSGLDVGAAFTPLLFGWLLDRGEPRAVFWVAAMLLLLTSLTLTGFRGSRASRR